MARGILRFLGTRYGMALIGIVLVLAVVGVARAISGSRPVESVGSPPLLSSPTASSELGDDSVANSESPPVATAIPGAAAPERRTRRWIC